MKNFEDDESLTCKNCKREIVAGNFYIKHNDMHFCDTDCLAEYLIENTEWDEEYLMSAHDKECKFYEYLGYDI